MGPRSEWLSSVVAKIAAPPAVRDPADALSASLVGRILDLLFAASLLFALVVAAAGRLLPLYALTVPAGLLLLLGLRWALYHGHVHAAAYALCALGWLIVSADLWEHGPNTIAVGGFLVFIVVTGLTLGRVGALALTAATVGLLAPFMLGVIPGHFNAPTGPERLVHYTTQLVLAGTLSGWWAVQTRRLVTELRRSEARRSLLLEASPDAIVSADAAGIMTFQNRAAEQMLGYPASEVVGRPWPDLPHLQKVDVARLSGLFSETISQGTKHPSEEITLLHRDGHRVITDVKGVPLYEDGGIVGAVAILRDVTARKRAEAERASLQRQLATAQRMEAVGRLAGGLAHDFNNLLTIILASVETGDSEALDDIREAARRGVTLTRQLLAFGGRKPADARPTDVHQAIAQIRPMLGRVLGANITIDLHLAPTPVTIVIDAGQLDQILVNLAANARDAMPHGGTLTIATALRGEQVELRVADTGIGMDEATRASAFEPFFTTKGDRGTGLGLAVVQNIVGDAGATVTCASAPGQGTSFVFTFPASEVTPMPRPSDLPAANATQRRIVFVDDNTLLRGVVVRALRRAGFLVDAFDGANDVDAIDARLEGADALITDLVMPGRSGVDLALELRRRKRPMPILFVSGYAEHELLERVRDVPRSSVLEKPFTAQDVIDRLGKLQQS
jgi:hypothetical protein